jgi:Phosphate-selective porin O and P
MKLAQKPLFVALVAAGLAMPLAARADDAALQKRIDALEAQLQALGAELAKVKADAASAKATAADAAQTARTASAAVAAAPAAAAVPPPATATAAATPAYAFPQIGPNTVLNSYGEIQYSRPANATDKTTADVGRFVIGLEHRFDDRTRMASELEVEHAVSSADDSGEVEVEQLYIEHQFTDEASGKAGLFLMPVGLLNEHHEPIAYYGVFRNHVETAIIPTTWREIGLGSKFELDDGLTFEGGVTTGFDIGKWDPNSPEGLESPLGSIHQEGQLALARDLAVYGAVNWRGVPGLQLGGSIFYGGAGHGQNIPSSDAKVTLYEGHVRWQPGPWDLSALYARGEISDTAALNATFNGAPYPVPASFDGWYTQAAYHLWTNGTMSVAPFARYERYNTAKSFEGIPQGLGPSPTGNTGVTTVGVNYYLNPNVVFKADYQWQSESSFNRFNLGVGYAF